MQVLKDSLKEKIIEESKKEFLKKGYKNSSMRAIAKASGITVGNIYKYFRNKETLFSEIISPAYTHFNNFFSDHEHEDESTNEDINIEQIRIILNGMISIFSDYREEFLIIIDGSVGTQYEEVRYYILEAIEKNIAFHLSKLEYIEDKNLPNLSHGIGMGFMEGLFEIVREENNKTSIKELISDYLVFFIKAFLGHTA